MLGADVTAALLRLAFINLKQALFVALPAVIKVLIRAEVAAVVLHFFVFKLFMNRVCLLNQQCRLFAISAQKFGCHVIVATGQKFGSFATPFATFSEDVVGLLNQIGILVLHLLDCLIYVLVIVNLGCFVALTADRVSRQPRTVIIRFV